MTLTLIKGQGILGRFIFFPYRLSSTYLAAQQCAMCATRFTSTQISTHMQQQKNRNRLLDLCSDTYPIRSSSIHIYCPLGVKRTQLPAKKKHHQRRLQWARPSHYFPIELTLAQLFIGWEAVLSTIVATNKLWALTTNQVKSAYRSACKFVFMRHEDINIYIYI